MASTVLAYLGQLGLGEARVAPSALESLRNITGSAGNVACGHQVWA